MNIFDAYYKKDVSNNYRGKNLKFHVSQSLFSSQNIDSGTRHLLNTLAGEKVDRYHKVLDLGCGYGPIGISLKSFYPACIVHMVDRDALALKFAAKNVELNRLPEVKIYGSLGYDDITNADFDLIVSNIPSKVGESILAHIVEDAGFYLRPGGKAAIVVIRAIGDFVTKVLKLNPNIRIIFAKQWPEYLVFHYEFIKPAAMPKNSAWDRGFYRRGQQKIRFGGAEISLETAYGLAEFDSSSFETEMILNQLKIFGGKSVNRAVIFNPKQGIIPAALTQMAAVKQIALIDRDLEALRVSEKNLIKNGIKAEKISLFHRAGLKTEVKTPADLIIGVLNKKDGPKVHSLCLNEAYQELAPAGLLMLASDSTPISRIESAVKKTKLFSIVRREKMKRKSLIILKRDY